MQRFVVEVEDVEVTSASSWVTKRIHGHGTELEAAIGENIPCQKKVGTCLEVLNYISAFSGTSD